MFVGVNGVDGGAGDAEFSTCLFDGREEEAA